MRWNKSDKKRNKPGRRLLSLIAAVTLAVSMVFPAYGKPDWPNDTGIQSESGVVMDMDSGTVLFAQNVHEQKAPASIVKLLTALVTIEHGDLDGEVTFSHDAVYNVESGSGNKLQIEEGDKLTVRDCLYLLLLQSSNQAANALAEYVAGSRDGFVDLMNQKAAQLGCQESHFANPSGLNDDTQLTSAYDMGLIGIAAYNNPTLLEIGSALEYSIPPTINNPNGRTFEMEHKLVVTDDPESENYFPAAVAGKTGYTSIAGQTLVTYAQQDGRRLIAVTMKSTQKTHYSDTKTLLDFGFRRFKNVNIKENETAWVTGEEPLEAAGETFQPSELYLDEHAVVTLPNDATFTDGEKTLVTDLPEDHPEQAVARIDYTYNERRIGSAWIYTTREMAAQTANQENGEENQDQNQESGESQTSDSGNVPGRQERPSFAFHIPVQAILIGVAVVLCVAAAVGSVFWYGKKQKEKEERRRILREKRRRRLEEIGCSQEEFEKMLIQRRNESGLAERPKTAQRPEADQRPEENQRPEADQRPEENQRPEINQRPEMGQRPKADQRPEMDQGSEENQR